MQNIQVEGAFAAPVLDAQKTFRTIMDAMAQPGTVRPFSTSARPPAPLSASAAAIALTLCDQDTPIWLDPALREHEAVRAWLGFHCGGQLAHTPAEAHFALVAEPAGLIALENFAQGTQEYPDRSTTLVLQVSSLDDSAGMALEGPGIESITRLSFHPMPRHFIEQWRQNNARFPRGVDVILAAPHAIACLARTTRITMPEG